MRDWSPPPAVNLAHPVAPRRAWAMVAILFIAYIVAVIDRQILSLIVDPIRHDLGIDDAGIGLLQGPAFALLYCTMGIPLGRLADRTSRKWIIIAGILLWSAATIGSGFAGSFGALFALRMAVGIGEAALVPAALSLISDSFTPARQPRATASFAIGALIGGGAGFLIGGGLLRIAEGMAPGAGMAAWRLALIAVGLPGPVLALAMIVAIREPARLRGAGDAGQALALGRALRFLGSRWRDYGRFYLTVSMLATISIPGLAWFPTVLMRNHGLKPLDVGMALGVIQLVGAIAGTLIATALLERMVVRAPAQAHRRTLLVLAVICVPAAILAPLAGSTSAALGLWLVAQIPLGGYYSVGLNALQLRTPNGVRALNVAIFMLVVNLAGLMGGTTLVGAITTHLFADPHAVGRAMAMVFALCGPIAILGCCRFVPRRSTQAHSRQEYI